MKSCKKKKNVAGANLRKVMTSRKYWVYSGPSAGRSGIFFWLVLFLLLSSAMVQCWNPGVQIISDPFWGENLPWFFFLEDPELANIVKKESHERSFNVDQQSPSLSLRILLFFFIAVPGRWLYSSMTKTKTKELEQEEEEEGDEERVWWRPSLMSKFRSRPFSSPKTLANKS